MKVVKPVGETNKRRQYSDREKAAALTVLADNNGVVRKTAVQLGITEATLRKWKSCVQAIISNAPLPNTSVNVETIEEYADKKQSLADLWEKEAYAALNAAIAKRDSAFYRDLIVSAGVAVDKFRLLRDETTANEKQTQTVIVLPSNNR